MSKPPEAFSVSVIIPTKNRPADLEAAVKSVLRQSSLPCELLIVDQSSGGESRRGVEQAFEEASTAARAGVKLNYIHDVGISGLAEARNRAMESALADIWLFLDDDVVLEDNFIKELLRVYAANPEVVGVSGVVTNYDRYSWNFRLWNVIFVRGPFADPRQAVYRNANRLETGRPIRVDRLGGGLMSFRAEAVRGSQFDSNLQGVSDGEDVEFCARLGPDALLMMAPRARLVHNQSPCGREQAHWLRRDARSQHYLYHRNWQHGFNNRVCFLWLNIGYALAAAVSSALSLSAKPWQALLAGIRDADAIPR